MALYQTVGHLQFTSVSNQLLAFTVNICSFWLPISQSFNQIYIAPQVVNKSSDLQEYW